ncbi:MAG: carboxypeptidase regulatory-like protein, partial [Actinomycetia bacterium]|nr:carboxypeptidase regulatory-like protein [Actinomycetes bacterium]
GTITVLIDVPRAYPAGELRVGIEVTPLVDPARRQIGESTLVVPAHRRATIALDPLTQTGGRRATFNITLANEGNAPLRLTLAAIDPEDKVRVAFAPPIVDLEPKQQVIVPARATGKRPLIGNPAPRMLTFTASGADNPLESLVSFIQRPRLGRGLVSLLGLLVAVSIFALTLTSTLGRVVDVAKVSDKLLERAVNGDTAAKGVVTNPGSAAGQVTLLTSGAGVSGVTVELFTTDNPASPVASAASAADGTYTFTGLNEGTYKVRFRGAGFVEIWYGGALKFEDAKAVEVALGEATKGLDIALGGVPGSIAGKVVGQDPKDAVVTLQLPASTLGSTTAAQVAQVTAGGDGAFLLEKVPAPASYELVVTKEGFATEKRVVNLSAAEDKTNVEIALRKGDGLISGLVTVDGKPLGGVNVTAANTTNESSTITLTSGTVGEFNLRNLATPGTYTLTFANDGFATQNLTVALLQGEQRTGSDMALARGTGSIAGTVTRQGTGPIGGVLVSVGVADKTITTETLSVGDVGTYLLTGLPIPGTYTVTFSGANLATQVRSIDLDPAGEANLTGLDTTMTAATAQVSGTVNDDAGPADGVSVVLSNGTDTWTTRTANVPPGSYLVRDVKPGTYTLTFSRDGAVPRSVLVSLSAGEQRTVNVTLEPRATIAGTVSFKTGTSTSAPGSGAFVVAYKISEYPGTVTSQTISDASGHYKLGNLSAPEGYIIEFLPPGGGVAKATKQITLQAGEQKTGVDATLDLGS